MNGISVSPLTPNQCVIYPASGRCARDMNALDPDETVAPTPTAGGDLNGTATQSLLLGQAGTAGVQLSVPRLPTPGGGSFTGVAL